MIEDYLDTGVTINRVAAGTMLAGRYRVISNLGGGGNGEVWLVEDSQLDNEKFAVKMLPSLLTANKQAYRQLKDEVRLAQRLVHPNILQIRAFEDNNGNPFILLDYIAGRTLADYLSENGRLGPEETLAILRPIAAALDYAHSQGVLHCDVSPDNLMIRSDDGTPFLLDFGIACDIKHGAPNPADAQVGGKPPYMSPERLNGAAPDRKQDIYSFAVIAYKCLTGKLPVKRNGTVLNCMPQPIDKRDCENTALARGIMSGLSANPSDRPESCMAILDGGTTYNGPENAARRNSAGVYVAAIAAFLVALGMWGYIVTTRKILPQPPPPVKEPPPPVKEPPPPVKEPPPPVKEPPPPVKEPPPPVKEPPPPVKEPPPPVKQPPPPVKQTPPPVKQTPPPVKQTPYAKVPPPVTGSAGPQQSCSKGKGTLASSDVIDEPKVQHVVKVVDDPKTGDKVFKLLPGVEMRLKRCENGTNTFWMGEKEVTEWQWYSVMRGPEPTKSEPNDMDQYPKCNVSLSDCNKFMNHLKELTNEEVSLPDTNSWEAACLAESTSDYWWGDSELNGSQNGCNCDYGQPSPGVKPVGRYQKNKWGLYDTHGNVAEWCKGGVIRGGGWKNKADDCKATSQCFYENNDGEYGKNEYTGFRVFLKKVNRQ